MLVALEDMLEMLLEDVRRLLYIFDELGGEGRSLCHILLHSMADSNNRTYDSWLKFTGTCKVLGLVSRSSNDSVEVQDFQCVASARPIFHEGFDTAQTSQVLGHSTYERSLFRWHGFIVLVEQSGIQVLYIADAKNRRSEFWIPESKSG